MTFLFLYIFQRTLMNCTSIIKAAYIKFMHTRFCVKSGYFHLEKEDCVISVFEKRDMFQYVDITPSEVYSLFIPLLTHNQENFVQIIPYNSPNIRIFDC